MARFPTNLDASIGFIRVKQNVNVLVVNWTRLMEFASERLEPEVMEVVGYASDSAVDELESINKILMTPDRTIETFMDLNNRICDLYEQFTQLISMKDFQTLRTEEFVPIEGL